MERTSTAVSVEAEPLPDVVVRRYTRDIALQHEHLYGRGYQGPGSEAIFLALAAKIGLRPGVRVLDVGCGLGGDALRLADWFDAEVVGLDAAPEMIDIAQERRDEARADRVRFVVGDVRDSDVVGAADFDVVWSRDSLAYVPHAEKVPMFVRLHESLRPGGALLVTDYGRGAQVTDPDFNDLMSAWGQHLLSFDEYSAVVTAAGFVDVEVEDGTCHLVGSQLYGMRQLERADVGSLPDLDRLRERWRQKLGFSQAGLLSWPIITARSAHQREAEARSSRPILLTPGPACTSTTVRAAMLRGDICHREPEFADLLQKVRTGTAEGLGLAGTHEPVLIAGSGTAAVEMAISASVRPGRSILVVDNGTYGDRMASIARAAGITCHALRTADDPLERWTTPADPEAVRRALRRHSDVDVVACVHHETTTGLLNPVAEIGKVVAESEALFLLDAVSSTGIEAPNLPVVGADLVAGTANKGLHGLPGAAFVLCSEQAIERLSRTPARSVYFDLAGHLETQRAGQPLFTPAIQVLYAFDQALTEYMKAGGYAARTSLYRERAAIVRSGFAENGLSIVVPEECRSNSVSTLKLPEGVTYQRLHDELKQRGYVVYAAQNLLARTHFRICTFGEIPAGALERLPLALAESLTAAGGRL